MLGLLQLGLGWGLACTGPGVTWVCWAQDAWHQLGAKLWVRLGSGWALVWLGLGGLSQAAWVLGMNLVLGRHWFSFVWASLFVAGFGLDLVWLGLAGLRLLGVSSPLSATNFDFGCALLF